MSLTQPIVSPPIVSTEMKVFLPELSFALPRIFSFRAIRYSGFTSFMKNLTAEPICLIS